MALKQRLIYNREKSRQALKLARQNNPELVVNDRKSQELKAALSQQYRLRQKVIQMQQ